MVGRELCILNLSLFNQIPVTFKFNKFLFLIYFYFFVENQICFGFKIINFQISAMATDHPVLFRFGDVQYVTTNS